MPATDVLKSYALGDLCSHCRDAIKRFRSSESFDDSFCFEVFRRAIVDKDQDCWRELQSIYHDQVLAWCRQAVKTPETSPEDLAVHAWEKFWQSFGPENIARSPGTPAIQRYLKMCAITAAIDVARERHPHVSLDNAVGSGEDERPLGELIVDPGLDPEQKLAQESERTEFWQLIDRLVANEAERSLLYLKFELELKPADLPARRPDLFPTVEDVYRITRNLLDRFKRNPELLRWFRSERS